MGDTDSSKNEGLIDRAKALMPKYKAVDRKNAVHNDRVARERVEVEIRKAKDHIADLMELAYEEEELDIRKSLRSLREDADHFLSEIQTAPTGLDDRRFKSSASPGLDVLNDVTKADVEMVDRANNVAETLSRLHGMILDNQLDDVKREILQVRRYITDCRGIFRERSALLHQR